MRKTSYIVVFLIFSILLSACAYSASNDDPMLPFVENTTMSEDVEMTPSEDGETTAPEDVETTTPEDTEATMDLSGHPVICPESQFSFDDYNLFYTYLTTGSRNPEDYMGQLPDYFLELLYEIEPNIKLRLEDFLPVQDLLDLNLFDVILFENDYIWYCF